MKTFKDEVMFQPWEPDKTNYNPLDDSGNNSSIVDVKPNTTQISQQVIGSPSPTDAISKNIAENPLPSPYIEELRLNEQRLNILKTMPRRDENGKLKSGLRALLEGLSEAYDPKFGVVRDWTDFSARMARAGGKAVGGLINPSWDEEKDRQTEITKIGQENQRLMGMAEWESKMKSQEAQRQNLIRDDERAKQSEYEKLKETKRRNWYQRNKFFAPETATEAQRKELSEFGETPETIGHYDFTKPETKTVGGVVYKMNPSTKSYEPTNLPKDGSKALIDYVITDPDTGVEYKYTTTSEKAASLKTSLIAAGMQIKAANERQINEQNFRRSQDEIKRDFEREERAFRAAEQRAKDARDDASRSKALQEQEESRVRIIKLQKELEDDQ